MRVMARLQIGAGAIALSAFAAGCGGLEADGAPTAATDQEFCLTYAQLASDLAATYRQALGATEAAIPGGDEVAEVMHQWSADMVAVGTPDSISSEARTGFELWVEQAADIDGGDLDPATLDGMDPSEALDDMSTEDFNRVRAFNTFVADTCSHLYRERGIL